MTTFIPTKWEVKRLTPCQKDGMVSQPDSLTVLLPSGKWGQHDWLHHHKPTSCEAQCTAPLSGQSGPARAQDSIPAVTAPPDCKHNFTGESQSDMLDLPDACCLFHYCFILKWEITRSSSGSCLHVCNQLLFPFASVDLPCAQTKCCGRDQLQQKYSYSWCDR